MEAKTLTREEQLRVLTSSENTGHGITRPETNIPISFDCQLPGGPNGFWKYADMTEEDEETETLRKTPYFVNGHATRLNIHEGSIVNYGSFIFLVEGFDIDEEGREITVLYMAEGGSGIDYHIACHAEILSSASTWELRSTSATPFISGDRHPGPGQWLYVIRNGRGKILYIGISYDATNRWTQHQKDKPWFDQAASFERIWYPTREAVELAESAMISHYRPPYNTQHNPDKITDPAS